MAQGVREEVVHARLLRFYPELVTSLGGDAGALLHECGLDPGAAPDERPGASYSQIVQLIARAAEELCCPDFGLRLGVRQSGGRTSGPIGLVMRHSRTFGEALDYVIAHSYAHSPAAGIWRKRVRGEKAVFIGHDILVAGLPDKRQLIEQILLIGQLDAMAMTGGAARARSIHFRHAPISPIAAYRRYFGCEIAFGQKQDGAIFSEEDLACPIVGHDAGAYRRATAYIDERFSARRPPLHVHARAIITDLLGSGRCANQQIAAELGIHPRTMHRRLRAEGTSFRTIKSEVRRDLLRHYVERTEIEFSRISELLGFAEQAVLTRTCNAWFGASPTRLRRIGRRAAGDAAS